MTRAHALLSKGLVLLLVALSVRAFCQFRESGKSFSEALSHMVDQVAVNAVSGKKLLATTGGIWIVSVDGSVEFIGVSVANQKGSLNELIQDAVLGPEPDSLYLLSIDHLLIARLGTGRRQVSFETLFTLPKPLQYLEILGYCSQGVWLMSIDHTLELISDRTIRKSVRVRDLAAEPNLGDSPLILFSDNVGGTTYLALMYERAKYGYVIWDPSQGIWQPLASCGSRFPSPLACEGGKIIALGDAIASRAMNQVRLPKSKSSRSIRNNYDRFSDGNYATSNLITGADGIKHREILDVHIRNSEDQEMSPKQVTGLLGQLAVVREGNSTWCWPQAWQPRIKLKEFRRPRPGGRSKGIAR